MFEALFALRVLREFRGENLDGNRTGGRVSRALQTRPILPAPIGARISYRPGMVPGAMSIGVFKNTRSPDLRAAFRENSAG